MAPQAVPEIQISIQGRSTSVSRHPNLAEVVHASPKTIDDDTVRTEAMETCTGFGRVYAVDHALEIDGFFCLAIDPCACATVYVGGIGIVTDDTELGIVIAIGAVQAQQAVASVAVLGNVARCGVHDIPTVLGCGVSDCKALDHAGNRHSQIVGAAWNRLNRGMALDGNGAAACDRGGDGDG
jgi:hypothetical protein